VGPIAQIWFVLQDVHTEVCSFLNYKTKVLTNKQTTIKQTYNRSKTHNQSDEHTTNQINTHKQTNNKTKTKNKNKKQKQSKAKNKQTNKQELVYPSINVTAVQVQEEYGEVQDVQIPFVQISRVLMEVTFLKH
jgi:hypothetical protein